MANTRYKNILKMFSMVSEKELHLDKLKALIKIHLATREIIVRDILKDMEVLGFIKEDSTRPFIYFINKNGRLEA